MAKVTGRLVLV